MATSPYTLMGTKFPPPPQTLPLPTRGIPLSHQPEMVPKSAATQPTAPPDVGTDESAHYPVPAVPARVAPVAGSAVRRHLLEVGAECVSSACSDLCGGRSVMSVPTAIKSVFPGADVVNWTEGNMVGGVSASNRPARRGRRPWHVRTLLAREPGDLQSDHRPTRPSGPHREGEEP